MRNKVFRVLAAILGLALVIVAVPISKYGPSGSWPPWILIVTFFFWGAILIIFAVTGRSWPRFYDQKVFGADDESNDR